MTLATTFTTSLTGLEASVIRVEADIASNGLPQFVLTGCPDAIVKQARDRVRSAINNSGTSWPNRKITVGLSPASVPKVGAGLDLAIAVAVLVAGQGVDFPRLNDCVLLGELGLDGSVHPVSGVLPSILGASRAGLRTFVVPRSNLAEATLVPGEAVGVSSLLEVLAWLSGKEIDPGDEAPPVPVPLPSYPDLVDVVGQERGRRALEVAAAGAHHVFMSGPPGVGKTMLAERLPGLLPELGVEAALEVTAIHSVAGKLVAGGGLMTRPPFSAPHHSSSAAALIGGGARLALPGAASLAHRGVLFLDEAPEFGPRTLDSLRQPLESGQIVVGRAGGVTSFAARFQLVLASNPCSCSGSTAGSEFAPACTCSALEQRRYRSRLSGPLLDRIDMRLNLTTPSRSVIAAGLPGESSQLVRERVCAARDRAVHRLRQTPWSTTADVPGPQLRRRWPLPTNVTQPLDVAFSRGRISARGVDRALKIAWTIADLAGLDKPTVDHVVEALDLRQGSASPTRLLPSVAIA